jgi:porin
MMLRASSPSDETANAHAAGACGRRRAAATILLAAAVLAVPIAVAAQDDEEEEPAPAQSEQAPAPPRNADEEAPSHEGGLWERDVLTGDWGGRRTALEAKGVKLELNYMGEALGNATGGVSHGAVYEGRLEVVGELDLEKLMGWRGGLFHVSADQIHGRGLSANYLGNNLLTASGFEAERATRLFELWLQQQMLDGLVSLRVGQLAADEEFVISQYGATFINSTFGWPTLLSVNAISGGPAYPLATPGARIAVTPSKELSFAAAVFNGDPAGPGPGSPQERNPSGTSFRIGDGAFTIAEAAYAINQEKDAAGLPATYKLGGYYATGRFADPRLDDTGLSLADPASSGQPATRHTDFGFYLIADQMLWRKPATADQGLAAFLRIGGDPSSGHEISFYADAGLNYKGLLPDRPSDVLGVAFGYAKIGSEARGLDGDVRRFTGIERPIRDFEAVLEVTYKAEIAPWWTLQPDLQFIFHPGGNIARPDDPNGTKAMPNALVLGLRSTIAF